MTEREYFESERILNHFTSDIRKNNSELSKVERALYKATLSFSFNSWKVVRGSDYWENCEGLPLLDRRKYLLNRVNSFLKTQ
jgi:hypothetical protein